MRAITTHKTSPEDRQPLVLAVGNIGPGGAEQNYAISYAKQPAGQPAYEHEVHIDFISLDHEGITNEALLAIVIDRLEGFQAGPFACTENAAALDHARICLGELKERTRSRIMRGVENTQNP